MAQQPLTPRGEENGGWRGDPSWALDQPDRRKSDEKSGRLAELKTNHGRGIGGAGKTMALRLLIAGSIRTGWAA